MKWIPYRITNPGLIILCFVLAAGCKAGKLPRKILPDQLSGESFSDAEGKYNDQQWVPGSSTLQDLPIYATDTILNGKSFTAIYLRNQEIDSLAFSLLKMYEPFAESLLEIIENQGIKGVVLDFRRRANGPSRQANFQVGYRDQPNKIGRKFPNLEVIFLWDEISVDRAGIFMEELKNNRSLVAYNGSPDNQFSPAYKQNCFKPASPDFEQ